MVIAFPEPALEHNPLHLELTISTTLVPYEPTSCTENKK